MAEVTVIIPTRNRATFLRESLASALSQQDVDLEVIVVDDASEDSTPAVVASFVDARVRHVVHDRPEGVARTRNHGARIAAGEWLAFLDDDDLWAPDKLARQLAAARNDEAAWVYGGAVEIDAAGGLRGGSPPPTSEVLMRTLRRRNTMPAGSSNVVVRRTVFDGVGRFDPALRHLADWDLWLRLADAGPPTVVPAPVVGYRQHEQQATLDTTGMLNEAKVLHERHGIPLAAIDRWMAWSLLRLGDRSGAVRCYLAAASRGDIPSLARAFVALAHPRPMATQRWVRRHDNASEHAAWSAPARAWMADAPDGEPAGEP